MLWIGRKSKVSRVKDGRKETWRCPECDETCTFFECEVESKVHLYRLIDVWDSKRRVFRCSACDALVQPPDDDASAENHEDAPDEAQARAAEQRRAEAAAIEREAARELRRAERRAESEAKSAKVDDELAALKKKLGLD